MVLYLSAIIAGFAILVWSADKFVDGAASTARHLGMPSLLIGILIVGFGTSAPEMVVSAIAAMEDNPSLALGNALGSNIVNIALKMIVNTNNAKKRSESIGALAWVCAGTMLLGLSLIVSGIILSIATNGGGALITGGSANG